MTAVKAGDWLVSLAGLQILLGQTSSDSNDPGGEYQLDVSEEDAEKITVRQIVSREDDYKEEKKLALLLVSCFSKQAINLLKVPFKGLPLWSAKKLKASEMYYMKNWGIFVKLLLTAIISGGVW